MPMVVIVFVLVGRAGMNKKMERGVSETEAKADQSIAQNASKVGIRRLRVLCERGQVFLGQNPGLEGKTGRKRANHDKPRVLGDDPLASTRFFAYQVTKNAPPVCLIVSFRRRDLLDHAVGVVCLAKRGDRVEVGEPLAEVHARDEETARRAVDEIAACYRLGEEEPMRRPIVLDVLTRPMSADAGAS